MYAKSNPIWYEDHLRLVPAQSKQVDLLIFFFLKQTLDTYIALHDILFRVSVLLTIFQEKT